jgi:hypothetical protein
MLRNAGISSGSSRNAAWFLYNPLTVALLLQLFHKFNACPAERIHKLLNNPRIREHLAPESQQISTLGIHFEPLRSTKLAGRASVRKYA